MTESQYRGSTGIESTPGRAGYTRVAVLGLGNMGSSLATALTNGGQRPTVWNRSEPKTKGFRMVASSALAAIEQADLVVACLADYSVTRQIIERSDVTVALGGRTLVQLASGTAQEARDLAAWAAKSDVDCLDGKIFTYPARIGAPQTVIAYSGGSAELFERHRPLLNLMAGSSSYFGAEAGAAATLDLAWLSVLYGATVGIMQGAAFCRSNGVDLESLFRLVSPWLGEIRSEAASYERLIATDRFDGDQATIDVHLAASHHLLETARSSPDLTQEFPEYLVAVLSSLSDRGMGNLDIAAAIYAFFERN